MGVTSRALGWIAPVVLVSALAACGSDAEPATGTTPSDDPSVTPSAATRDFGSLVDDLEAQAEDAVAAAGGALVYVRQGDESTVIARGVADEKTGREMEPDDTVMIGSVTKTWLAAATMSLVADGTLALDDTVEKWVPGLLPKPDVTVEQLLSMTAGLETYDDSADYPGSGRLPTRKLVELAKALPGFRVFEPGSKVEESNTNYAVLGLVVEAAGGAPVPELVRDRVFAEADLQHSAYGGTPTAHGYDNGEDVTVVAPRFPSVASGGVATVTDLGDLLDALLGGRIVTADVVEQMTTSRGDDGIDDYGLGLRTPHDPACPGVFGQKGGNAAFATRAWTNTELDRTVVVVLSPGSQEGAADTMGMDAMCG